MKLDCRGGLVALTLLSARSPSLSRIAESRTSICVGSLEKSTDLGALSSIQSCNDMGTLRRTWSKAYRDDQDQCFEPSFRPQIGPSDPIPTSVYRRVCAVTEENTKLAPFPSCSVQSSMPKSITVVSDVIGPNIYHLEENI